MSANGIKSTRSSAERMKAVQTVVEEWRSKKGSPAQLAAMVGELSDQAAVLRFARDARKATRWDQIMFAWKAGLISGLTTTQVNLLSNLAYTGLCPSHGAGKGPPGPGDDEGDPAGAVSRSSRELTRVER